MEAKLENLIEKIKTEGIYEAKDQAKKIIDAAQSEAKELKKQARTEAQEIIKKSQSDAAGLKRNAETALNQAARDVVLLIRQRLIQEADKVIKNGMGESLTPEFMKDIVLRIVESWTPQNGVKLDISEKDKQQFEKLIFGAVNQAVKNSIEISVSQSVDRGFRIGEKGQDVFYDFSDESILGAIKEFLNPAFARIFEQNNE